MPSVMGRIARFADAFDQSDPSPMSPPNAAATAAKHAIVSRVPRMIHRTDSRSSVVARRR
jgi:hypothetical protein